MQFEANITAIALTPETLLCQVLQSTSANISRFLDIMTPKYCAVDDVSISCARTCEELENW